MCIRDSRGRRAGPCAHGCGGKRQPARGPGLPVAAIAPVGDDESAGAVREAGAGGGREVAERVGPAAGDRIPRRCARTDEKRQPGGGEARAAAVEIVRRLIRSITPERLKGTLICIPIVNVLGFLNHSRYLPDGRDLNRSFPGSPNGSLTARLANLFLEEIISKATHGIDLHTGGGHRANLPHIRANLDDPQVHALARSFDVPALANPNLPNPVNPAYTNAANWQSLAMVDDGTNGDAVAGDDVFTATVPGQPNRTLVRYRICLLYTSPSPRARTRPRMPSSA